MCVDFVKQTNGHLNSIKRNYELGYQQCTNDVATYLNTIPDISFIERQHLLNHLSSQYERIHWKRVDSRLSNLNHDYQQDLLIDRTVQLNENINKRFDGMINLIYFEEFSFCSYST